MGQPTFVNMKEITNGLSNGEREREREREREMMMMMMEED